MAAPQSKDLVAAALVALLDNHREEFVHELQSQFKGKISVEVQDLERGEIIMRFKFGSESSSSMPKYLRVKISEMH
jgi:hypothetical protein